MIRNMMPVLNIVYIHKHLNVKFPNQHDLMHLFKFDDCTESGEETLSSSDSFDRCVMNKGP